MRPRRRTGAKSALRAPIATSTSPGPEASPHDESLARGQRRVEDGDVVAEARAEASDELRRQRDLRDEHDGPEPALARGGDRAEVDLGLAAAGHAVKEERRRAPIAKGVADGLDRGGLRGRGLLRRVALGRLREERIFRRRAFVLLHEPQRGELLDRGARVSPARLELGDRLGAGRAQVRQDRRGLSAQRTRLFDAGRWRHPLHGTRDDALAAIEEARLRQLAGRVALQRREREAHDLADGREVVGREIPEERERVLGDGGRLVDDLREGLRALGRLVVAHRQHDADHAAAAEGTDDAGPDHGPRRERLRDAVRERARQRDGQRDVAQLHVIAGWPRWQRRSPR